MRRCPPGLALGLVLNNLAGDGPHELAVTIKPEHLELREPTLGDPHQTT